MYIILINIATFIIFGVDKYCAMNDMWRISEKALLTMAAAGGSVGAYAGMQVFRHKTRKPLFNIGVPALFVIQVIIMGLLNR